MRTGTHFFKHTIEINADVGKAKVSGTIKVRLKVNVKDNTTEGQFSEQPLSGVEQHLQKERSKRSPAAV